MDSRYDASRPFKHKCVCIYKKKEHKSKRDCCKCKIVNGEKENDQEKTNRSPVVSNRSPQEREKSGSLTSVKESDDENTYIEECDEENGHFQFVQKPKKKMSTEIDDQDQNQDDGESKKKTFSAQFDNQKLLSPVKNRKIEQKRFSGEYDDQVLELYEFTELNNEKLAEQNDLFKNGKLIKKTDLKGGELLKGKNKNEQENYNNYYNPYMENIVAKAEIFNRKCFVCKEKSLSGNKNIPQRPTSISKNNLISQVRSVRVDYDPNKRILSKNNDKKFISEYDYDENDSFKYSPISKRKTSQERSHSRSYGKDKSFPYGRPKGRKLSENYNYVKNMNDWRMPSKKPDIRKKHIYNPKKKQFSVIVPKVWKNCTQENSLTIRDPERERNNQFESKNKLVNKKSEKEVLIYNESDDQARYYILKTGSTDAEVLPNKENDVSNYETQKNYPLPTNINKKKETCDEITQTDSNYCKPFKNYEDKKNPNIPVQDKPIPQGGKTDLPISVEPKDIEETAKVSHKKSTHFSSRGYEDDEFVCTCDQDDVSTKSPVKKLYKQSKFLLAIRSEDSSNGKNKNRSSGENAPLKRESVVKIILQKNNQKPEVLTLESCSEKPNSNLVPQANVESMKDHFNQEKLLDDVNVKKTEPNYSEVSQQTSEDFLNNILKMAGIGNNENIKITTSITTQTENLNGNLKELENKETRTNDYSDLKANVAQDSSPSEKSLEMNNYQSSYSDGKNLLQSENRNVSTKFQENANESQKNLEKSEKSTQTEYQNQKSDISQLNTKLPSYDFRVPSKYDDYKSSSPIASDFRNNKKSRFSSNGMLETPTIEMDRRGYFHSKNSVLHNNNYGGFRRSYSSQRPPSIRGSPTEEINIPQQRFTRNSYFSQMNNSFLAPSQKGSTQTMDLTPFITKLLDGCLNQARGDKKNVLESNRQSYFDGETSTMKSYEISRNESRNYSDDPFIRLSQDVNNQYNNYRKVLTERKNSEKDQSSCHSCNALLEKIIDLLLCRPYIINCEASQTKKLYTPEESDFSLVNEPIFKSCNCVKVRESKEECKTKSFSNYQIYQVDQNNKFIEVQPQYPPNQINYENDCFAQFDKKYGSLVTQLYNALEKMSDRKNNKESKEPYYEEKNLKSESPTIALPIQAEHKNPFTLDNDFRTPIYSAIEQFLPENKEITRGMFCSSCGSLIQSEEIEPRKNTQSDHCSWRKDDDLSNAEESDSDSYCSYCNMEQDHHYSTSASSLASLCSSCQYWEKKQTSIE